jgi:histidine triad (HIT) family protein
MACLFCQIAAGEIPADKVREDDRVIVIRDINPQAPTHVLVIPREHIETVEDLEAHHAELLAHLFAVARETAAAESIGKDGYRLVLNVGPNGGQTVYHIHMHLLGGRFMSWPPG